LLQGGGLQVLETLAFVAALSLALGLELRRGISYGALVALSSTAILLKALLDRGELDAPHGRVALLIVGGRLIVPRILDRLVVFRDRELFTICILFLGLGAAFATASFGLSLALGAFLAGLTISESDYGLPALSAVLPFATRSPGSSSSRSGCSSTSATSRRTPFWSAARFSAWCCSKPC
jgi:CPA2 family monovalent cation:H+ antiporter-2